MHRLLTETGLLEQEMPTLPTGALKHLKVIRPKPGEEIELFDGNGKWRVYSFSGGREAVSPLCAVSPLATAAVARLSVTLFACVTKGSRWDWTVEKATELGVCRIVPVISKRTIVRIPPAERAAKRDRWRRIAEDAARQSDAKWIPEICEAVDFEDALPLVKETACFIGALTTPPSPSLLSSVRTVRHSDARAFSVFIGPEGDFTPEELSALMAIAAPTSFGPTVLRAETAAIYALSVLVAALQA